MPVAKGVEDTGEGVGVGGKEDAVGGFDLAG